MTKNDIIQQLFIGENFNACIQKMEPEHLREDLRQEVILVICELPEERIIQLQKEKALEFFTVKVILNQIKSRTSPFYKKYRGYHAGYTENIRDSGEEYYKNGAQYESFGAGKYIIAGSEKPDVTELEQEERELREQLEDIAIGEVDKLYWYNKGLIELYVKHSNYRAIETVTGIPFGSCYKTIRKSLKEIKEKVNKPGLLDQVTLNRLNLINTKEYLNHVSQTS